MIADTLARSKVDIERGEQKPVALSVHPDGIPLELRERPQWVLWRYERRQDRWTKLPINAATAWPAKSTDPNTWVPCADAVAAYQGGAYAGIGFVFFGDDPYCGVDLDDCRDMETGSIQPWAQEILDSLQSYAEISPSQTGIKVFVRASLPAGRNRQGHVEIYDRGRYFAVTGHHLPGTPNTVEQRQEEVEALQRSLTAGEPSGVSRRVSGSTSTSTTTTSGTLPDDEIIRRASEARNGDKFRRLWSGDSAGYPSHSEADAALCSLLAYWCEGPDADRIDRLFRQSGLYRDKWERADYRTRTIQGALAGRTEYYRPAGNGQTNGKKADGEDGDSAFRNYREIEQMEPGQDKPTVIKSGLSLQTIKNRLMDLTDGMPKRVGDLLFARGQDNRLTWIQSAESLMAYVGGQLPGDSNRIHWLGGANKVTQGQFFAYLRQTADNYDAVESFPHEPALPGHYYAHPEPKAGDGTRLRALLDRFQPATDVDRDLILAAVLTPLWGGRPGQRPAFLVTTDDNDDPQKGRGAGKSTVAKFTGQLFGGLISSNRNESMEKLTTRLLSPSARTVRVVLLDNIKSLKFSWAELEAMITSNAISGHQMYQGEGRRPNTLTWFLTVNGASLSRDMAQRVITIKVKRPKYSAEWEDETTALIDAQRWEIIGDCLQLLCQPPVALRGYSRWGAWERWVLSRVDDPAECQRTIRERQETMDDDASESAVIRDAFRAELIRRGHNPDEQALWIPAAVAAGVLSTATNERWAVNRAGVYLATMSIPELRKSDRLGIRGWAWSGTQSPVGEPLQSLNEPMGDSGSTWQK